MREDSSSGAATSSVQYRRVLGRLRGAPGGPALVVLTGIHGNEASGVEAALRVLADLERRRPPLCGDLAFLAGNLSALSARARFIDLDLNRQWTPHKVATLGPAPGRPGEPVEHAEQRELLAAFAECIDASQSTVHFLDLHTSSADGPPFATIGDTLRNRAFAQRFPLPLILGLEEQVDGALLELLNNHGLVTMGVEAGRHDAPESVERHEAVLWIALVASGVLREADAPPLGPHRDLLRRASRGVPPVIEVRQRHGIRPEDRFRMQPGYANFRPVARGEILAHDASGPVRAPEDGLLLLPLYQGLGDDGFFLAREVLPVWLRVSAVLRRLRVNRLMRFLPGVRRDPRDPAVLIVDTRIARFYPLEIFHLCGFRKVRQAGVDLVVSRRRYDLEPPERTLPLAGRPARA